ncbi:mitomycin antibiotics/polyketide fumonisin biosynthesis protein [Mycolicibacterium agri]|uniref:Mitomycin antibiotics/polyketide fumonisin biosynthesis protein n=1 Tax=Mycolicibacterium agri TaxID=36811 RepID=A0A2A7MRJ8_MYCAG|nr:mitomycin antibiotics/polyketide fumonisin biosynthesis protein [Mycolicibacterium agri]PEG34304.1 mitomycin antibiotics/polyketide fumonisin biosynthesis protein [Mycolicibacterium agri]GFG51354.1 phytanoyl-CoA dioxygenase [Mycolicibacterium agri]
MVDVVALERDGFVKIEQPELRGAADEARALLWRQIGLAPDDPASWTEPVRWAADMTGAGPFGTLVRSEALAAALDQVAGVGGWVPRGSLGNIPIRFPLPPTVDDRGWHIDANTPAPDGSWAISGRPHTLLLLTLLSDVGPDDAPTRIRVGSHRDVARVLNAEPVAFEESGLLIDGASAGRPVAYATGRSGDMYVVHPFTAHAADEHRGATPRFMAQSPVMLTAPLTPGSDSVLARVWD